MDSISIVGEKALHGRVGVAGAKNACLALMPAALLSEHPLTLTNVPRLSDIGTMTRLMRSLGAEVSSIQEGKVLAISAYRISHSRADYDIVRRMRASILVLGPLLARTGKAIVSLPGGCAIGARPVDLHLSALEALGAKLDLAEGYVTAVANGGLNGARIEFPFPSVGATETAIMAASLARGTTAIINAAREPEIVDLANCLNKMGAKISGAGRNVIEVEGTDSLNGATHQVIADRIELGTYMIASAITGGEIELVGGRREFIGAFAEKLEQAGVEIADTADGIRVARNSMIGAVDIETAPYPGFPTDLQAQMMSMLTIADGKSVLEEKIFENRFMHVPELARLGASIELSGGTATVTGVQKLKGAPVMATDLRASASLILAALAAEGTSVVRRVYHLDRGYEQMVEKLSACGASIERFSE
ncbi:MAG: UDP-N-acetylglucosamine 1-carboxyvinyltransferase [Albidovulum sp.]|nr:UDP-N-acetylglucosamine 1-carboxyvinyltransferase [Albidovulum sp.]